MGRHVERRGDSERSPWVEKSVARRSFELGILWADLVYWRGGAKLVVWADTLAAPVGVERIHLRWPWLAHMREIERVAMSFLERSESEVRRKASEYGLEWKKWAELNPALAEYLTATAWPDETERLTSTLLIFVEDGQVKACLNDRETSRTLWVTGDSIEAAIESLDGLLQAGSPPWRLNKAGNGNGSGRKPKKSP